MTAQGRSIILSLVVLAVSLFGRGTVVGSSAAWLLPLVGGAVLAGGVALAMARKATR